MSDTKGVCLKCNKTQIHSVYTCTECEKGLCEECGCNLRKERDAINKRLKCEYCHHSFDNFCQDCKNTVFNILKTEDERLARGPEKKFVINPKWDWDASVPRGEIKLVTPYPSPFGENRTIESVCKVLFLDRCCCDSRCKCLENSLHIAHKNQNIKFYVVDEHEGAICTNCFPTRYPDKQLTYQWAIC